MQAHNPAKSLDRKANGYRTSTSGHHDLPRDFKEHTAALEKITARLKEVIIENRPAKQICLQHDRADTLHYIDPPYPGKTRSTNASYYTHEVRGMEAHREIYEWANDLKGMVVLSGYHCDEYEDWFGGSGWVRSFRRSQTGAFCGGAKTAWATEDLWLNPAAAVKQRQLKLF